MRGSWRPNRTALYCPPPTQRCLSRPPGLLNVVFLVLQGCSTGGPGTQLSAGWWLSLLHLLSNFSGPQLNRGPRGPLRPGVAFPTTSRLLLQLSDYLSWLSYIIVQRPLNRPLNPWNGIFDCHQAEITVMQFTGHSLPVHHSVAAQWTFTLSHIISRAHLRDFFRFNSHWDVSLPLSLNGMFVRAEGQNTTVREGATPFLGLLHFTLDPYLIMLSVKQGRIRYHFWVFGMTRLGIEPHYPGPLANTLLMSRVFANGPVMYIYSCIYINKCTCKYSQLWIAIEFADK